MLLFYFLLFVWVLNSLYGLVHSRQSCLLLLQSQFTLALGIKQTCITKEILSLGLQLFLLQSFLLWQWCFPLSCSFSFSSVPKLMSVKQQGLVSSGWAAEAEDQSYCRIALLPLGHWLAVLFTWAYEFLWACLTLHELHGCFAFVFFSFNAHWSWTATSCSSALIYLKYQEPPDCVTVSNLVTPTVDSSPH